jgi:transposase InsO family protein
LGPATGLPTLRDCFPTMPRAELANLLQRYRRVWRQRYHEYLHVLHWQVPGAVWAMDFAEAPRPIDGCYPYLLAVRDLASSQQLAWLPVRSANALEVIRALEPLFVLYGAPLVLKSDNGSHFSADAVHIFLTPWGVEPLFSPPRMPSYNGAIEAGIGSLKTRTDYHATCAGHPADWTFDDTEAARAEANANARPQGPTGPTPDELWEHRRPIAEEERMQFRATVAQQRPRARAERGLPQDGPWHTNETRAVDREAIRRALEEHDYLLYSRRQIPLPFPKRKAANIR